VLIIRRDSNDNRMKVVSLNKRYKYSNWLNCVLKKKVNKNYLSKYSHLSILY
jgi:hypothetical protein